MRPAVEYTDCCASTWAPEFGLIVVSYGNKTGANSRFLALNGNGAATTMLPG